MPAVRNAGASPTGTTAGSSSRSQPAYGARVVIAGLTAIVIIFGVAVLRFNKAADVATAVGSVSGIVATLVGAYFGIRGATVAQAQAHEMMGAEAVGGPKGAGGAQEPEGAGAGGAEGAA